jgi:hypothetical protein
VEVIEERMLCLRSLPGVTQRDNCGESKLVSRRKEVTREGREQAAQVNPCPRYYKVSGQLQVPASLLPVAIG